MAAENDVFILWKPNLCGGTNADSDIQEIQGVVLPSRTILGKAKKYLEMNIADANRFWEEDGNSGDIPLEDLLDIYRV